MTARRNLLSVRFTRFFLDSRYPAENIKKYAVGVATGLAWERVPDIHDVVPDREIRGEAIIG